MIQTRIVDLWEIALNEEPADEALSKEEWTKSLSFRFEKDARHYRAGRAGVRNILSAYLGKPPASVAITYGQFGKPQLVQEPNLQFNLAKSRDLAVLAVAESGQVGVDLEYIDSSFPFDRVANERFTLSERRKLNRCQFSERLALFFHIWTTKEAVLKAAGIGLSVETSTLETLGQNQKVSLHGVEWTVSHFARTGYLGAVATCAPSNIRWRTYRPTPS